MIIAQERNNSTISFYPRIFKIFFLKHIEIIFLFIDIQIK